MSRQTKKEVTIHPRDFFVTRRTKTSGRKIFRRLFFLSSPDTNIIYCYVIMPQATWDISMLHNRDLIDVLPLLQHISPAPMKNKKLKIGPALHSDMCFLVVCSAFAGWSEMQQNTKCVFLSVCAPVTLLFAEPEKHVQGVSPHGLLCTNESICSLDWCFLLRLPLPLLLSPHKRPLE